MKNKLSITSQYNKIVLNSLKKICKKNINIGNQFRLFCTCRKKHHQLQTRCEKCNRPITRKLTSSLPLIFFIFFSIACERPNWNEDAKNYKTVCTLPKCTKEDYKILCSQYPYIHAAEVPKEIYEKLNCVYCSEDYLSSEKINKFCEDFILSSNETP